ncbi:MAG: thioredoxin domain-containing protein [Deltaproteobacteria bacterium]|nr:thioredoxin domain-containing protein [Deltaproteobacteria bacterium]
MKYLKKYRHTITILLAIAGVALMVFYEVCDTSCSYLEGDIWGVDLKRVGSTYMLSIIGFAAFKQTPFVRVLLAVGLGVEVHLFAFQVQNEVYCPFCLAFAVMVLAAFMINYEAPAAGHVNRRKMWLYFLGEVELPMLKLQKLPLLVVALLGYLVILFTFSGSVTPAYGQEGPRIPSLGKGTYEVLFFSDYFCPPCQILDTNLDPVLKELLAYGNVKITFIDVPFSKATPLYAKYYLYAVQAGADAPEVLRIRRTLFHAAQEKNIQSKELLVNYLKEQKISWKEYDEKTVLQMLNMMIKQNKINATPTCVIRYSPSDAKKYVGTDEIWDGLNKLKAQIGTGKK